MKLSGLIIETSPVHSTKSARPLSIVKFVFLCDNGNNGPAILLIELYLLYNYGHDPSTSHVIMFHYHTEIQILLLRDGGHFV